MGTIEQARPLRATRIEVMSNRVRLSNRKSPLLLAWEGTELAEGWGIQTNWAVDNPGGAINTATAGTFGTVTSFKPARVLQFGFKFTF